GMAWQDLEKADAVFAFNDLIAFGLARAFAERGARIPDDSALVGYDDVEFARYTSPALTTVRIPKETVGQQAATLLFQRIEGDFRKPSVEKILRTQMIIRETAWRGCESRGVSVDRQDVQGNAGEPTIQGGSMMKRLTRSVSLLLLIVLAMTFPAMAAEK